MSMIWCQKFDTPVEYVTSGTGQWCLIVESMWITGMKVGYSIDDNTYWLHVYFDPSWDVNLHGYIMGDPGWAQCLRNHLAQLKFSKKAIDSVVSDPYGGEMLLQTSKRVAVRVGEPFVHECDPLVRLMADPENFNNQLQF